MKTLLVLFTLLFSLAGFAQDVDPDMAAFLAQAQNVCGSYSDSVPCDCQNPAHTAEGSKCIVAQGDKPACCEKDASSDLGTDVTACHKYNDSGVYEAIEGSEKARQLSNASNQ